MKVEVALLHTPIQIKGIITDSSLNKEKYPGIQMAVIPEGLAIYIKGTLVITPITNVKCFIPADNEASSVVSSWFEPIKTVRRPGKQVNAEA